MACGVTTRCAWPGRGESVTELMPFMNFIVHSYTYCSDKHASSYWTFIRRRISMGFAPSLLKKTDDRTLFFFGACFKRGRHLYTTTAPSCCIPASYCHLSATLQTMSIIVVNLQDNRAVFRIFITILRFSFDSPSCTRIKAGNACKTWHWGAFVRPLLHWERIKLYTFWECVCSLRYRVCSFHAPFCHLRPALLYNIFQQLKDFLKEIYWTWNVS